MTATVQHYKGTGPHSTRWDRIVVVVQSLSCVHVLRSHGLQHARFLCPLLSPRVCSNSCPLSRQCYLTISSSIVPLLLLPSIFPSTRVFSSESALHIMWPTYWSFSNSPSNEYSDSLPLSHQGSPGKG